MLSRYQLQYKTIQQYIHLWTFKLAAQLDRVVAILDSQVLSSIQHKPRSKIKQVRKYIKNRPYLYLQGLLLGLMISCSRKTDTHFHQITTDYFDISVLLFFIPVPPCGAEQLEPFMHKNCRPDTKRMRFFNHQK